VIYLPNAHPKQTVHLPISPGWARVLRPTVTTAVPAALLHTEAVRQLLLLLLVDGWMARPGTPMSAGGARAAPTWRAIARAERASLTGCGKPSSKCAGCPPLRPVAPQFGRPMRGCEMRGWPAHPRDVIGRHLNLSPQGVGNRAKVLGLPQRARHFRSPR
jgi:hypothetical protein